MTTDKLTKAPATPLEQWKTELYQERSIQNLAKALSGTGYHPERFAYAAYMVVARNERLQSLMSNKASKGQLWLGVYAAAECGLSLQPHLQQMHLVPYGSDIQPIIGYQGHVYLISKAGGGAMSPPVFVFQRDIDEHRFRYRQGTKAVCDLDPVVKDPKKPKGQLRFVFSTYTTASGVVTFKCMEREEFLERRERSAGWKAFKSGKRKTSPWDIQVTADGSETGDWLAMCAKTVTRDFAKVLPKSTDHWGERAAKADLVEAANDGEASLTEVLDTTVKLESEKTANDRLKEKLGIEDAEVEPALSPEEIKRRQALPISHPDALPPD
jgi:recombinational DNA repair protein RecT